MNLQVKWLDAAGAPERESDTYARGAWAAVSLGPLHMLLSLAKPEARKASPKLYFLCPDCNRSPKTAPTSLACRPCGYKWPMQGVKTRVNPEPRARDHVYVRRGRVQGGSLDVLAAWFDAAYPSPLDHLIWLDIIASEDWLRHEPDVKSVLTPYEAVQAAQSHWATLP